MLINRERRQFVRWPKYVPTKVLLLAISAEYIHAWRGRIYTYKQTLHATHSRPVWGEKQSIIIVASTNTDGAATAFRWCAFAIARRVLCVTIRFAKIFESYITHTQTRADFHVAPPCGHIYLRGFAQSMTICERARARWHPMHIYSGARPYARESATLVCAHEWASVSGSRLLRCAPPRNTWCV